MEQILEYWRAFVAFADAHPLITWGVISTLLSLAIAERSRVDAWAERHPRLAAVLKILRGLGVDPWHLIAAASLLVSKRLPEQSQRVASLPKIPPAMMLCLAVLLLSGCMSPHEGEHFNVAGIDVEGMAWRVDCALDNPETFYERWEYQNPNACAAELEPDETYSMCEEWMRVRYRYEWAKVEWLEKCGQAS